MVKSSENEQLKDEKPSEKMKEEEKPETPAPEPEQTEVEDLSSKVAFMDKLKAMPKKKAGAVATVLLLAIISFAVPAVKYAALNLISDADATIFVLSTETEKPVKGATVELSSGVTAITDEEGKAFFNDIDYGNTSATISKNAYESATVDVVIKKDNIELGPFSIVPTGVQVEVMAVSWLNSTESVGEFNVVSEDGESEFVSEAGVALVNVPLEADGPIKFVVKSAGRNDANVSIDPNNFTEKQRDGDEVVKQSVGMVLEGRHFFASDRDGTYAYYSSNYDGSDVTLHVDTKHENIYPVLVDESDHMYVAVLSSEPGQAKNDRLTVIQPKSNLLEVVDESTADDVSFGLIEIDAKRIIYWVYYDGTGDKSASYRKIKSYEFAESRIVTVFEAESYFTNVYVSDYDAVFIAENTSNSNTFFKQSLPGNERTIIKENTYVGGMYVPNRDSESLIFYSGANYYARQHHSLSLTDSVVTDLAEAPENPAAEPLPDSERGEASPDGTRSAWIDSRDGKGRIILSDSSVVAGEAGEISFSYHLVWLDDTRVIVQSKGFDYLVDVDTGATKKITAAKNVNRNTNNGYGYF